jgi:hypothetical protein
MKFWKKLYQSLQNRFIFPSSAECRKNENTHNYNSVFVHKFKARVTLKEEHILWQSEERAFSWTINRKKKMNIT